MSNKNLLGKFKPNQPYFSALQLKSQQFPVPWFARPSDFLMQPDREYSGIYGDFFAGKLTHLEINYNLTQIDHQNQRGRDPPKSCTECLHRSC